MDDIKLQALTAELGRYRWSNEAVALGIKHDFRCVYCGRDFLLSIDDFDTWQFDHVVPASKNGPDAIENKVIACKLCNFTKRNFDPSTLAGPNATLSELTQLAKDHVQSRRAENSQKLNEIKGILREAGLISEDRFVNNKE